MKRYNILAVDDDEEITGLLQKALPKYGMAVETAGDCRSALHLLDQGFAADVILLDYFLPDISGDHLAKELLKRNDQTPVVFFTAADTESLEKACLANVVGIIKKPFELEEVAKVLQRACSAKLSQPVISRQESRPFEPENQSAGQLCEGKPEPVNVMRVLLSTFSHAMKNSLQTISYYVELLEKGYIGPEDMPGVYGGIKKKINEFKTRLDLLKSPEDAYGWNWFSPQVYVQKAMTALSDETTKKELIVTLQISGNVQDQFGQDRLFLAMMNDFLFYVFRSAAAGSNVETRIAADSTHYQVVISVRGSGGNFRSKDNIFETTIEKEEGMRLLRAFKCLLEMEGSLNVLCSGNAVIHTISFPATSNVSL